METQQLLTMSKEQRDMREEVAKAYTRALERSEERAATNVEAQQQEKKTKEGCCSKSCTPTCCQPPSASRPSSVAAEYAGYTAQDQDKYHEAACSSFGCGNPLAFTGVQPGQTVLDLGSGAGFDLLIAAEKVGPTGKVIGVDMTDAMIDAARRNAIKAGYEAIIDVRRGHIEQLPVQDHSVDWVISNCVINLSPDKPAVFREIARVLKPGGQFSVSDIVVESLPEWLRDHVAAYAACVAGAIPQEQYLAGLRDAGLVDVKVKERFVYQQPQIEAMNANDLEAFGLDTDLLSKGMSELEGKIASVKVIGRRPE